MLDIYFKQVLKNQNLAQQAAESRLFSDLDDDKIVEFIRNSLSSGLDMCTAVSHKIADALQLLKTEAFCHQVSLEEIGQLYIQLINVHPYDISLYEAAFHYYDSVMDDSETAKEILRTGLLKIQDRINMIKELS